MRVPVLLHFEHDMYNTGFERFASVLKAYPNVNFIGHAQTWWGNISADLNPLEMYPKGPVKKGGLTDRWLSDYPNLYGDLSAGSGLNAITRDPAFGRDFLQRHGRRLMWGSDYPPAAGREGYGNTLRLPMAQLEKRTEEERAAIFGGTALKVFPLRG